MSNDASWGFAMSEIEEREGGFQAPPVGTYMMEVVEIKGPTENKKGEMYIIPVCEILEADEEMWIGRKYSPYMALTKERAGYTKLDLRKMGASDECLSDDGDPNDIVGLVFTVDLIQNGDYINMRNIEAVVDPGEEKEEEKKEEKKPSPRRRGGKR